MPRQDVEFKTMDGLLLRAHLYPVNNGPGPAVILTPGFGSTKEMVVPEVAEAFQQAGFTALTYDPRCMGASEGTPRHQLDPQMQVSDYSDALTFLATQPMVDSGRITFWGYSFAGMVALCAAALDKRAKQVISVCPLTDYSYNGKRARVLAKTMKDRASQVQGNEPFSLPILTPNGENPAGFAGDGDPENYRVIESARLAAPTYENKATIQTYYKIAQWQPLALVPMVAPTPCFVITPQEDKISLAENQTKLVQSIPGENRQHVEPGKGHMDILAGEGISKLMAMQIEFLKGQV